MAKIIIKRPNENMFFVEDIPERNVWQRMREIVGSNGENATLDRVHLDDPAYSFTMYADDDGLLKGLPINFFMRTNIPFMPTQPICGTVCFARGRIIEDDIEYTDVTDDDIVKVCNILEISKTIERSKGDE